MIYRESSRIISRCSSISTTPRIQRTWYVHSLLSFLVLWIVQELLSTYIKIIVETTINASKIHFGAVILTASGELRSLV